MYDQEDLLFGIASVPESAALAVLERLGVSQDQLRTEAESTVATAPALGGVGVNVHASSAAVRAAPRAQVLLALAEDEARLLGHSYLEVEHLLLAMVRQGSGPGWTALARLGVGLEPARAELLAYIAAGCSCDACRRGTGTCP